MFSFALEFNRLDKIEKICSEAIMLQIYFTSLRFYWMENSLENEIR